MCADVCAEACTDMYPGLGTEICVDMCVGIWTEMHLGTCMHMCIYMCVDMCTRMWIPTRPRTCANTHVETCLYKHLGGLDVQTRVAVGLARPVDFAMPWACPSSSARPVPPPWPLLSPLQPSAYPVGYRSAAMGRVLWVIWFAGYMAGAVGHRLKVRGF